MMLDDAHLTMLEAVLQGLDATLHVEDAVLDAGQTLTLTLCTDSMCFPPLRLTASDVDIAAVLAGQPAAQDALRQHLRTRLQGLC